MLSDLVRRLKKSEDKEVFEEEVKTMLDEGMESGAIKEDGKRMIDAIFEFDDKVAYEIMTPRTDVFAIDVNAPTSEYIDELMELTFSRIPVYENDMDNVIGILNIKDFMIETWRCGALNVNIRKILRKPYFCPDTKKIDSLLIELRKTKQNIAILIDEYGGFSGIVTMEDIIEEIVGEIEDEYDEEEKEIEKISESKYILSGNADIDDVNEATGLSLESENNETIGGLLIELLGEIPEDDESGKAPRIIRHENLEFKITSVKERRIERAELTIIKDEN